MLNREHASLRSSAQTSSGSRAQIRGARPSPSCFFSLSSDSLATPQSTLLCYSISLTLFNMGCICSKKTSEAPSTPAIRVSPRPTPPSSVRSPVPSSVRLGAGTMTNRGTRPGGSSNYSPTPSARGHLEFSEGEPRQLGSESHAASPVPSTRRVVASGTSERPKLKYVWPYSENTSEDLARYSCALPPEVKAKILSDFKRPR